MDKQPSSIANFVEPRPESVKLRSARVRVELSFGTGGRHSFYRGFADEISATGIFVGTHVTKPIGERMDISIRLPDSEDRITGTCEVRWISEYSEHSDGKPGMGLRFLELAPGSAERISEFLLREQALFFDDD